jgi:hypothetical protein
MKKILVMVGAALLGCSVNKAVLMEEKKKKTKVSIKSGKGKKKKEYNRNGSTMHNMRPQRY